MQNNVKYVFTHFVKYVTLDRSSAPTHYDEYLKRANVGNAYMRSAKFCSCFGGTDLSVPYDRRREICIYFYKKNPETVTESGLYLHT